MKKTDTQILSEIENKVNIDLTGIEETSKTNEINSNDCNNIKTLPFVEKAPFIYLDPLNDRSKIRKDLFKKSGIYC